MKVARAADRLRSAAGRASVPGHQHTDAGTRGGPDTTGADGRMIVVQHTGDPNTAGRALQVEHKVGAVTAPTSRTACRRRRRVSDNGSRHARPEEARTARSPW